ncbi:MAG: flagellar brake protein [Pseudomonadota bacterium]
MENQFFLKPGLKINLVALGTLKSRYATQLLGWKKSLFLLMEAPVISGLPARLEEGTRWAAHFVNKGEMVGFQTEVIAQAKKPAPLFFSSYPAEVDRRPLRQEKRFPVRIKAIFHPRAEGIAKEEVIKGTIVNISSGGCQLKSTGACPVDSVIQLFMALPDSRKPVTVQCEVKSCRAASGGYIIGLGFLTTSGEYALVRDYVSRLGSFPLRV